MTPSVYNKTMSNPYGKKLATAKSKLKLIETGYDQVTREVDKLQRRYDTHKKRKLEDGSVVIDVEVEDADDSDVDDEDWCEEDEEETSEDDETEDDEYDDDEEEEDEEEDTQHADDGDADGTTGPDHSIV